MDKTYILPDGMYDVLKWLGLIALPAIATFISIVGPVWGMADVEAVVTTLNALGTLVGVLIGISHVTAQ